MMSRPAAFRARAFEEIAMVWLGEMRLRRSAMRDMGVPGGWLWLASKAMGYARTRFRGRGRNPSYESWGVGATVGRLRGWRNWHTGGATTWKWNLFMSLLRTALRILPVFVIAAAFCLGTPGAWAQTAMPGASTATPPATETAAEKKKDAKAAKEAEESKEKAAKEAEESKEKTAKEEKGKTETGAMAPAEAGSSSGQAAASPPAETKTGKISKAAAAVSGKSAGGGLPAGGFGSEAQAKASCPMDTVVWENTSSKVYHAANSKYYGKTKHGAYACSKAAASAGFKAASN